MASKPPKQKKSHLYSRELESFVGSINADIYRDIELEAAALNENLSNRRERERAGRPPKGLITIKRARADIFRLFTRCHQSSVPPPLNLLEAMAHAWRLNSSAQKVRTVQRRAAQMQKAAEIEAENLDWEGGIFIWGINPSALGKESKTDKNTITDWRENSSDYRQAVVDAISARLTAGLLRDDEIAAAAKKKAATLP
jgi:hypothetical protein